MRQHVCFLSRARNMPMFESSFAVPTVKFAKVSEERFPELHKKWYVVFVHNTREPRPDGSEKPEGFGNPGGGVRPEETAEQAVRREVKQETALIVTRAQDVRYEHSLVISKPDGKMTYIHCDRLGYEMQGAGFDPEKGSLIEYLRKTDQWDGEGLSPRQTLTHTFVVEVDWAASQLHDLFLLQHALNPQPLESGIILQIPPELADQLGIVEAKEKPSKRQEIDAIGLFPVEALPNFYGDKDFYLSHVWRAQRAVT